MPQGGNLPFGLAPSGELTSYTPTLRERATDWVRKKLFTDDRAGQQRAGRVMDVASVTPFGFGLDMYDAGREVGQGNLGAAGTTLAMSFAPGPSPKKIRAFHGSPHDFDRFDMSKIGTGEGAQAYGHGLYFAEAEDVARGYRDTLKPGKGIGPEDTASRVLDMHGGDIEAAISSIRQSIDRANANNAPYEEVQRLMQAKNILNTQPQRASGRMYEVNINADPDTFLDWDKPFANADELERFAARFDAVDPTIRKRIEDWGYERQQAGQPMPDGSDLVREVFGGIGSKEAQRGQQMMREAGIPGIKYLDAGSRGNVNTNNLRGSLSMWESALRKTPDDPYAQQQVASLKQQLAAAEAPATRNYVVFDDRLISIVRKYGIAGASAILGYNILDGMDPAQAEELKRIEGNQ